LPPLPQPRFDLDAAAPCGERALSALDACVAGLGLDPGLLELIRVRASQLNGCVYCIDMHTKDAHARGETAQRLYALSTWREAPYYSDEERAALAWTDALTIVSEGRVSGHVYDAVRAHFDERGISALTLAVIAINAWNRVAISQRLVPGAYVAAGQ